MSFPYTIYKIQTGEIVASNATAQEKLRTPEGPLPSHPDLAVLHIATDPATQRIVDGEAVPRDATVLAAEAEAAAARAVRERRFALLHRHVDQISGVRWSEMTSAEKTALRTYRQALLDMPETGVEPTMPAVDALTVAKQRALGTMLSALESTVEAAIGDVPASEIASWPVKEDAARRFREGAARAQDLAILDAELAETAETRAALADRIVARADAYRALIGRLAGMRRKVSDGIGAAGNNTEIRAALAPLRALQE